MMNCLVTGGAGFIGSHLVDALVKKGAKVRVLDNFSSGKRSNLSHVQNQIEVVEGNILDRPLIHKVMVGIDTVFHQAALRSVPASFDRPSDYNEVNIQGTLLLLEEALNNKVKKFVFASSSSVYGDNPSLPKKETDWIKPISPYAATKLAGENYCHIFSKNYGLPTVSLRYFNVFGPRQPANDGYSPVIPKFIDCIIRDQSPPIYGDGTQSRDFTYVENIVLANVLAMEKREVTGIFNVGTGKSYNLLFIVDLLNQFLKKNVKPHFLDRQRGDVMHTLASIEAIEKDLGYRFQWTFEQGLKRTLDSFKKI